MSTHSCSDVIAVILTYNAPDSLRRCLDSVQNQTTPPAKILIVDNASEPPASIGTTPPGVEELELVRNLENLGPAGGHAVGLQRFADSRHESAWVMDDDCVPALDCLELLTARLGELDGPSLVFPTWIDEQTGKTENYPAWCGLLIPKEIVTAVGLPRSDFFWWAEDTEYLHWRIPEAGFGVNRVEAAEVLHTKTRRTSRKPPWKIYYETRNSVYFRLHVQRGRGRRFFRLARVLVRTPARILAREDRRFLKLVLFLRGVGDGVLGRMGKRVKVENKAGAV